MSKRVIDLTNEAENSQQRVIDLDEEDGMQVDVVEPPRRILRAPRVGNRSAPMPNLQLQPDVLAHITNGPTETSERPSATSAVATYHRGLPNHMSSDAMADEVVLTSFVIFKRFVEFPPEIIELLCNWICAVYEVKENLSADNVCGSFPMTRALVYTPECPLNLSTLSLENHCCYYDGFAMTKDCYVPFRNFVSRICCNIIQLVRAEFECRQLEYVWKTKLDALLSKNFPGQKAFLTQRPNGVSGSTCRLQIPYVKFSLCDFYGNVIRPFTFTGFQYPFGNKWIWVTIANHNPVRNLVDDVMFEPTYQDWKLRDAMEGVLDKDGVPGGLIAPPGLQMVGTVGENARVTFHLRDSCEDEEEDKTSFKFVLDGF